MTKKIIFTVLVAAVATSAYAGSVQNTSEGSSNISTGIVGASSTTVKMLTGSLASSINTLADGSVAAAKGSVFVIEHPSQASQMTLDAGVKASTWTITTSGDLVKMAADGSVAFLENPSASTSAALKASGNALRVTLDASGRMVTASGAYLKDTYGKDMALVSTGSGEIYTVAAGSVVIVFDSTVNASKATARASVNAAKATAKFLGDTVVDSVQVSAHEAKTLIQASAASAGASFDASTQSGRQYNN